MLPINQNAFNLFRSSSRTTRPRTCCKLLIFSRGAKMWVPVPQKAKTEPDNLAPLLDSLRLVKAVKIDQPDLPIELTIEPLMKKTVNANVLKGRFVLTNPVPSPASSSSGQNNESGKDVIAVILDDQSADDVRLAKELGVDHFGGQDLLDRILAEEVKPTKLLVHSKSPKIQNIFTSSESKKTLFKTLSQLNLIIPSEKRGTMSENLNELIMNSKNSIDWLVKKKPTTEKPIQPSDPTSSSPVKAAKVNNKNSKNQIDSFISIPVGSIQMNLIHLEQNISDFLSMVSNLTQFGTASTTTASKSSSNSDTLPKLKSNFKSGRPIKKPGIYKATLTVKGIPPITVI
ncbi:uncharacterized protein PGTG_13066 [Puccinia graminis f. sp. tritici CRL 75-36-700-3]|uniref:Uncharacterized protein n=1 Tax=Puccinia graminis f. sp. tritici (strain CRL 75-36-700-3 / race SCCL) TaxID=418459 RepID=E3KQV9_PUCGT|nr:uncharacterized protein PGTG_13066 [Puccinia graminis f. sp. tritici CRL 75-36-700-3]EFP86684.2 hypothetical protein PGTG_13066 [Puccinia graminis f. sp. tritici CRL 75-36-700-3]